jgi:anti-anti-sigma factor
MSAIDVEKVEGVAVARVVEDIDAANVSAVKQRLEDALGPDALRLIVDLSDTRYVDSAGIDMLLRLGERLRHRRARLILVVREGSGLRRLVDIVGLPTAVALHARLEDAVREAKDGGEVPTDQAAVDASPRSTP